MWPTIASCWTALLGLRTGEPDAIDRLRDARSRAENGAPLALRARVLATRLDEMRRAVLAEGLAVSIDLGLGVVFASGALADPQALLRLREQAESLRWSRELRMAAGGRVRGARRVRREPGDARRSPRR